MTDQRLRGRIRAAFQILLQRVFLHTPVPLRVRIVRFLTPSHTVGALCLIECGDRLLMLRQRHRRGWTLPGGLLDRGETPEQTVCRELLEETGLHIEVALPFGVFVEPRVRRVDVLYRVIVEEMVDVTAASEAVEARWLLPSERGVLDGPTADALALRARLDVVDPHVGRVVPGPPAS